MFNQQFYGLALAVRLNHLLPLLFRNTNGTGGDARLRLMLPDLLGYANEC